YQNKWIDNRTECEMLISQSNFVWVKLNNGNIPPNSVIGSDSKNKETLYVCRGVLKERNNSLHPGAYIPSEKKCYVPFYDTTYAASNIEILTVSHGTTADE